MSDIQEEIRDLLKESHQRQLCDWQNYQKLIKKFKQAVTSEKREQIRNVIKGFAQLCGAIPEIEKILESVEAIELTENDFDELHASIERYFKSEKEEEAKNIERIVKKGTFPPQGFFAMLESAHPAHPTTPEREQPANSEFQRMFREATKNNQAIPSILIQAIDEAQFPDLCNPDLCPKDYARHCRANREDHYGQPCIYKTLKNK